MSLLWNEVKKKIREVNKTNEQTNEQKKKELVDSLWLTQGSDEHLSLGKRRRMKENKKVRKINKQIFSKRK